MHSFLNERTKRVKLVPESNAANHELDASGHSTGTLALSLVHQYAIIYNITLIKYADDLTDTPNDTSSAKDSPQNAIDDITKWCVDHNMLANRKYQ